MSSLVPGTSAENGYPLDVSSVCNFSIIYPKTDLEALEPSAPLWCRIVVCHDFWKCSRCKMSYFFNIAYNLTAKWIIDFTLRALEPPFTCLLGLLVPECLQSANIRFAAFYFPLQYSSAVSTLESFRKLVCLDVCELYSLKRKSWNIMKFWIWNKTQYKVFVWNRLMINNYTRIQI